ncbi:hypothetical protein NHP21005_05160 [Helicobacter sp. NHP21005]|nr:hypothetical protein NHP21005_05160 [Helicobacter sp. NHP21005]
MKKPSKLSLKISHAIARRIKANQAERAGVFAFKEAPKIVPRPSSPMSKALSKGAFVVGAITSYNALAAYDLGNQTHIVGYMWNHHNGEFYYGSGGYYCGSYWCNDGASLTSNNSGTYLLSQLTWKGGSLNIGLNNATLNVGTQGSNTFTNYYDTATFNDTINARNINLAQTLNLERDTNLSISASQSIGANNATLNSNGYTLALKGQNGNFSNTSLNGGSAININVGNLTLNNVSFNDANTSVTNTGTLNIQNTITLTHNSPLTKLASTITLSPNAIFNITQNLSNISQTGGSSYSILNTTGNINTSSYGKALWNLIRYNNQSASLYSGDGASEIQSNGETIYHVAFNEGGKQYIFGEAFGPKSISIFSLQPTNVWGTGVLPLNGSHDFSVGPGGVAYINPNAANPTNGYKILDTTPNGLPASFGVNIKGNDNTLVLGNDTANPINWQTSKAAISIGGNTHTVGTITGAFNAYNIYMTNTFQTGNNLAANAHNIFTAQYGGHGTTITFSASNNLTMDDLRYWERIAGDEQSSATFNATNNINVSNSTFIDNTRSISAIIGGNMKFNAQNTTFNNSQFSGDQSQISLTGTQTLTLTDTQINNGMSTISLNAGTLNMDCDGKHGSCAPDFNNNPPFGASGFSGINAEHLLVNAQTATFTNTTLNIDPVSGANAAFSTNNLTFNNTTFSGDNTFSFQADNKGGQVTTFEGTTTLDTAQGNQALSPFATALSGQVILGSNAVFNIQNTLNNPAKAYTILDTQNAIQASNQDYLNTYAGRLWQLIHYQGQSASSAQQVTGAFIFNNQTYNIPAADKAYMVSFGTARFLETFGNNSMALQYVSQAADVWKSVYPMQNEPNVPQSYNVGINGVAFIDPAHNHNDPGYNPGDNSLSANSQVSGGATDTTIIGNNATLVIGNDQLQAIGLNAKQRASVNLDPSEKTGNSSSTTLSAPNVLLTNDLNIGSSKGGSGDLNISAQNTMTMDGLDFNATGSQQTNQNTFTGTQSLNIQNSNLNANGGALSLNSQNIQLNHANLTGQSDATITLNASSQSSNTPTQINAANTDFKDSGGSVKLNAQNITLGTSTQGTLYDKSVSGAVSGAVSFTTNNTALSIAATGALNAANTTFSAQNGGSISLSSGQNLSLDQTTTFEGSGTAISLNAAKALNITGQAGQAGFNDTNGTIQLQGQSVVLNTATFAGNGNSVKILGAGGSGAADSLNATDTDFNNSQDVNISANSATFTNGNFSQDQNVNIASSGDGNFNSTNFNTAGNININAGDTDTFNGTNFNTTADVNITAHNKATFENNSHFTKAQNINITANTANFEDTAFNTTGSTDNVFKIANATFDGATFNTHSAYNFSGNTQTTFSGITSIGISGDTTFAKNLGDVDFSKGSLLSLNENEILNALKGGKTYTLLSGSKIDYDAQYAHSLYQMVQFGNTATTLAKNLKGGATQGGDTWYVSLGGETIKESFGANALTFSLYVPPLPPNPNPKISPKPPAQTRLARDKVAPTSPARAGAIHKATPPTQQAQGTQTTKQTAARRAHIRQTAAKGKQGARKVHTPQALAQVLAQARTIPGTTPTQTAARQGKTSTTRRAIKAQARPLRGNQLTPQPAVAQGKLPAIQAARHRAATPQVRALLARVLAIRVATPTPRKAAAIQAIRPTQTAAHQGAQQAARQGKTSTTWRATQGRGAIQAGKAQGHKDRAARTLRKVHPALRRPSLPHKMHPVTTFGKMFMACGLGACKCRPLCNQMALPTLTPLTTMAIRAITSPVCP